LLKHARHRVVIFVDSVDLAVIEALRYADGLGAEEVTAVHFVIDAAHAARLQQRWEHFEYQTRLRVIDCPDRNLSRAAQELVVQLMDEDRDATVTVLLPRRGYAPLVGRFLHDRTADKIAGAVSRVPGATAQILAYDVGSRIVQAARTRQAGQSGQTLASSGTTEVGAPLT
jgi:hypothetical protein